MYISFTNKIRINQILEHVIIYRFKYLLCVLKRTVSLSTHNTIEPRHEISNNVVCEVNKGSDQPAHMRSLIRASASRLNIL